MRYLVKGKHFNMTNLVVVNFDIIYNKFIWLQQWVVVDFIMYKSF